MSVDRILENWADYDDRKTKVGSDAQFFSCDEVWEIYYLRSKIHSEYSYIDEMKILIAIESCCRNVATPIPRNEFVRCVMNRLGFQ